MNFKDQVNTYLSEIDSGDTCSEYMEVYSNKSYDWMDKDCPFKREFIDRYGGEDMGSEYWSITKFSNSEGESVLVKFYGFYQSHYGCDYGGYAFVQPVTKTVTVYE